MKLDIIILDSQKPSDKFDITIMKLIY